MTKSFRLAVAAATIALGASLTPVASAQEGGLQAINEIVDKLDCNALRTVLEQSGMARESTTRDELAATLRNATNLGAIDPILGLAGNIYAGRIADRALTCGIVKANPQQDIITQLQNLSSNLSS
ncbi:hypothetical protein [Corynebacterium pacaense]|uniref:hypothetical protein n=1 Tax=Corynebacterium pacaense TaxID=1816684 RepID=UPI0009B9E2BF|nr:hypothetical protein [Corynebacterium pacaense]